MTFRNSVEFAPTVLGVAVSSNPRIGFRPSIRSGPRAGPIAVSLVHHKDEIGQLGKIIVVALPDHLLQLPHSGAPASAFFLVDLVDIEDVDVHVRAEQVGGAAVM